MTFTRSSLTWLAYGLLAFYAYYQAGLGPIMPFLRDELNLSYTQGGFYPSAFALGMIGAGLAGATLADNLGRRTVLWGGTAGLVLGMIGLLFGSTMWLTLPAVFLMGLAGTLVMVIVQAILSDHHGSLRATALTEANVGASVSATLPPLAVGALASFGLGWRGGLLLPLLFLVGLVALWGRLPIPAPTAVADHTQPAPRLPRSFWLIWFVLVLGVSAEWCVVLWSADYLETVVGFARAEAALLMALFFSAAVIGRITGSRLTRTRPSETLLLGAIVVSAVGFVLFWQAPFTAVRLVGLFISGLGIANLFPLALSTAVNIVPEQSNIASARAALGGGLAIFFAPLILGGLADQWGLQTAMTAVPLLLAAAFAL
ncbi:MAG: MFS transporter, partial [Anaerolineales bacterium]|nr:MFS transporter [Anaerolineales bacterium]